jgi:hypothetical protein
MLRGEKVKLRAVSRDDLPRLLDFYLERPQRDFDREAAEPPRDKTDFAIEADGNLIGHRSLFNIDETARHCELGISIGDKDYWGAATGVGQSLYFSTTPSGSGTSGGCGLRSTHPTSVPSAPTAPAALWRRAGCASTSGWTDGTSTTALWASCAMSGDARPCYACAG